MFCRTSLLIRRCSLAAVVLLCAVILGCNGDGKESVSGTVTYDGQPVEQGEISFIPLTAGETPDGGVIENGQFTFRTSPGKKRVEIRGARQVTPSPQYVEGGGTFYEDFIPAKFNRESTLEAEVPTPNGQGYQFELLSK